MHLCTAKSCNIRQTACDDPRLLEGRCRVDWPPYKGGLATLQGGQSNSPMPLLFLLFPLFLIHPQAATRICPSSVEPLTIHLRHNTAHVATQLSLLRVLSCALRTQPT